MCNEHPEIPSKRNVTQNEIEEIFPKSYKGFELISITDIPDCESKGIYLRHKKNGLEIFHLLNNDEENLFAFAFRTPIKSSTGAAHILEHSVFCGSQKFPLKEPFTNLMNQSVNTFLNAMTYSDKTVYPASSIVKADYYNLMDVYADAVFFPLLKKEAFMQEAHRLELNDKNEFEIQGVVYNEMKGNYSSFDSVASDAQIRSIFPDTVYAYDSGGDPLCIPSFSYEDFKKFHKKYYKTNNCLLFLYGNIPTKEQIDFLEEKILNRLPNSENCNAQEKFIDLSKQDFLCQKTFSKPRYIEEIAPKTGSTGCNATINYLCEKTSNLEEYMECAFLTEILIGHDGSPLTKALLESNLGDDLAPLSGCINEMNQTFINFGLHGIKKQNAKKVFSIIESTLENLFKNGIDKNDIDSSIMSAEFSNREILRNGGPFSLVLLDRVLNRWTYGESPAEGLLFRDTLRKIKKNIESDKNYIQNLIKKYIIENKSRSYTIVSPSNSYLKNREKKEKELIKKLAKNVDKQKLFKELDCLHAYQNYHETEQEASCIKGLSLDSLSTKLKITEPTQIELKINGNQIPFFASKATTNGIAYFEVWIPIDNLLPEEYKYLTIFSYCATNSGWNKKSWIQCATETAVNTGGIVAKLILGNSGKTEQSKKIQEKYKSQNIIDRKWLVFSCKMIEEKINEALSLFAECISTYNFTDEKRISNLTMELLSAVKANAIPHGNKLCSIRSNSHKTSTNAIKEITQGITQLFAINKIAKENTKDLCEHFEKLKQFLATQGAIIHATADENTINKIIPKVSEFAKKINILPPKPKINIDEEEIIKQTLLEGEETIPNNEIFTLPLQVGYACKSYDCSLFGQNQNPAEIVLAHYLSGTTLWEKIRTQGGAYGASANCAYLSGTFNFSTYRDPTPQKSLSTFDECLELASKNKLSEEELKRMISGTYGEENQPHSPKAKASIGFNNLIFCISNEDKTEKIKKILKLKPEDIQNAAKSILEKNKTSRTAIIANNNLKKLNNYEKNTSIIIDLPL